MSSHSDLATLTGHAGAGVLVDASIKAALVLLAAAIAARALHWTSAAVRHRVWSLGLCGALLTPILSLTVPQMRLPVLPVRTERIETPGETRMLLASDGFASRSTMYDRISTYGPDETAAAAIDGKSLALGRFGTNAGDESLADSGESFVAQSTSLVTDPNGVSARSGAMSIGSGLRAYLFGVWLAGLLIVVTPLAAGFVFRWILLQKSRRLENVRWVRLIAELSARIGLKRAVAAFESPRSVVPMTWGFVRPTVLVPASWRDWPDERRRCVLLHELAHVKRLDVVFQLIGRFAVGLHWFNPLAWYALRRLRIERELACDDCVLASGERASDYARELLQIARLYRPRRLAMGVAMAQSARLDQRILGILDQARSRLPVSRKLACCLFAIATVLVVALSSTRLVERPAIAVADENSINRSAPTSSSRETKGPNRESGDIATVTGVVLRPDGEPAAGSWVYAMDVATSEYLGNEMVRPLAKTVAADDGTFSLKYTEPPEPDRRGFHQALRGGRRTQFVAVADGFAVGLEINVGRRKDDPVRLQLAPPEASHGRLIDLEGRPLRGVKVEVRAIAQSDEPLDDWFQRASKNRRPDSEFLYMRADTNDRPPPPVRFPSRSGAAFAATGILPNVWTDAQGRFEVNKVGPDRLVVLEITAPTIARTTVKMVTRRGPSVFDAYPDPRLRDSMIHGAGATIAVEPAVVIQGSVAEADTGRPIANCQVEVTQVAGSLMAVEDFAATTTDESGNYALDHLPPDPPNSRGYRIRCTPPADAPFFPTDFVVRVPSDRHKVTFDVRLPRARWIDGRILDENTGEPVRAFVGYLPTLDNTSAPNYPNFDAGLRTASIRDFRRNKTDGSFRVPAINDRGVLCVTAEHMAAYAVAGRADRIDGLQHEGNNFGVYHLAGVGVVNEFREFNLTDADDDPMIDVALRPLSRRPVRLVDKDGQPVTGCYATGLMPNAFLAGRQGLSARPPLESAETAVVGLEVESRRPLAFHHPDRHIGAVIVARDQDTPNDGPLSITLRPYGNIRGRLLDENGEPVEGRSLHAIGLSSLEVPESKHYYRPGDLRFSTKRVETNREGRFEIHSGVLPGARYKIIVSENGPSKQSEIVESGRTVDVGDIIIPAPSNTDDDDSAFIDT